MNSSHPPNKAYDEICRLSTIEADLSVKRVNEYDLPSFFYSSNVNFFMLSSIISREKG